MISSATFWHISACLTSQASEGSADEYQVIEHSNQIKWHHHQRVAWLFFESKGWARDCVLTQSNCERSADIVSRLVDNDRVKGLLSVGRIDLDTCHCGLCRRLWESGKPRKPEIPRRGLGANTPLRSGVSRGSKRNP
ncbi:hypothetical protein SISNIDRAFT_298884 [Sistotremastrum niveocremeum HHB9708]|uniref:Uncharacterized protein n=1 Tax=Sistotremastrum niveocremeum HHB9708 TaxID=1314777 RepID=A0A164NDX5_9AGAM|nr:hypothetical protein SISNIDRAFT_298884 [Sistotremastrum niveocremeum HHB9708]